MKSFQDYGIHVNGSSEETATTCPQCSSSRKKKSAPCLSVNTVKGVWLCHHCGWSGNLDTGVSNRNDFSHWRKPKYRKLDFQIKPETIFSQLLKSFMDSRGISEKTLVAYKITERKVYMPQREDVVTAICFPYYRDGELINAKYRDYQKNFRLEAGAELIIYNQDNVKGKKRIIVTEGEIDALSFAEIGLSNVCSVPNGAPATNTKNYQRQFTFLDAAKEVFDGAAQIVLAVDADEPGQVLEAELSRRFGREKCLRVEYPPDCKDPNDVLVKHGAEALKSLVDEAIPYPVDGLYACQEFAKEFEKMYHEGYKRGISTGWKNLDSYYTVRGGEMTVVTGIPSHGKSEWMDALMVNMAQNSNWRFAVFSPENAPLERHLAKIVEKCTGKPFFGQDRMGIDEVRQASVWASDHFYFIAPSQKRDTFSLDDILDLAKTAVYRYGVNGILIDPWNDLDYTIPPGLNETQWIAQCLVKVRNFTRSHDVHTWIVAHPTKLRITEDGKEPVPSPYDISGSSNWRNKADNCITIWRDLLKKTNEVEVNIQKIKFKEVGRIGKIRLYYHLPNGKYYEKQIDTYHRPPNGKNSENIDSSWSW